MYPGMPLTRKWELIGRQAMLLCRLQKNPSGSQKVWTNPDSNRRPPAISAMLSGCDNQLHHMPDVYSVLVALLMAVDIFLTSYPLPSKVRDYIRCQQLPSKSSSEVD